MVGSLKQNLCILQSNLFTAAQTNEHVNGFEELSSPSSPISTNGHVNGTVCRLIWRLKMTLMIT